ncbi:VC0807 family protein [Plantactinospora siamensis]|uniref:VC0807 family protein n=1 Tax=Plantactinospora siamensis TaxID=555372 RepID=A0ABV6P296_9ACTN
MTRFRTLLLELGPTILFNIVLPYLTYSMLTDRGTGTVAALAISAVWPVVEILGGYLVRRRIDEFGVLTLILIVLGIATSVIFDSPRLALVKESAITGLFGLVLLGSLLAPRPLMFYFGRKFATGGSPERIAWWDGLWQYPGFRHTQRVLTVVWGITFLVESVVRVVLSYQLAIGTMVIVGPVLAYVVVAALVTWTIVYARRSQARAARANPAAAGPDGSATPDATGDIPGTDAGESRLLPNT